MLHPHPGVEPDHSSRRRYYPAEESRAEDRAPSTSAWAIIVGVVGKYSGTLASLLDMDFSETSLRHEYATFSSRREGAWFVVMCPFFINRPGGRG